MDKLILVIALQLISFPGISQSTFFDQSVKAGMFPIAWAEGISVGDYNNDGFDDFYVSYTKNKNQLYKNLGDGTFVEVAENLGLALSATTDTRTATWGDINNDGWLDLYVGNKNSPDKLFLNQGAEQFQDISLAARVFQKGHPKSVNMADVNGDGYLDIYISNFGTENVMLLNKGDNSFQDITYAAGALDKGRAMGSIFFDYDKDGDIDLYLVHDGLEPNFLYQNDGEGKFTEIGKSAGVNTESFGMGVDIGDINNDGWMDIHIANLGDNILLLNQQDGSFKNISTSAKIEDAGMGWGTNFLDFDNDGFIDIYVANDFDFSPTPFYNVLFKNMGNLSFEKVEKDGPASNSDQSYGSAYLDFNRDGNMDILVANRGDGEGIQVLQNAERSNNWLGLKLIGIQSNRQAIGARIVLVDNSDKLHYKEVVAGSGWASQSTSIQHIGLHQSKQLKSATIYWPSGLVQQIEFEGINQYFTIIEDADPLPGIIQDISTTIPQIWSSRRLPLQIFPNPIQETLSLSFYIDHTDNLTLQLFNQLGQLLFSKQIKNLRKGDNLIQVPIEKTLPKQMLILRISNQKYLGIKKVFKH